MTSEDFEDMDWLEKFPRPEISPGTDLSGLNLDGCRTNRSAKVSARKAARVGWLSRQDGAQPWEWKKIVGRGGELAQTTWALLHLPKYLILECPWAQSLDSYWFYLSFLSDLSQTHGFKYYLYRDDPQFYISSLTSHLTTWPIYLTEKLTSPLGCLTGI